MSHQQNGRVKNKFCGSKKWAAFFRVFVVHVWTNNEKEGRRPLIDGNRTSQEKNTFRKNGMKGFVDWFAENHGGLVSFLVLSRNVSQFPLCWEWHRTWKYHEILSNLLSGILVNVSAFKWRKTLMTTWKCLQGSWCRWINCEGRTPSCSRHPDNKRTKLKVLNSQSESGSLWLPVTTRLHELTQWTVRVNSSFHFVHCDDRSDCHSKRKVVFSMMINVCRQD